jgi:hypothetical protein
MHVTFAEGLDPAVPAKVEARIKAVQAWAAEPAIVNAVKAHNAPLPADSAAMTQDKWKTLPILDPFVRAFSKNEAGERLKVKHDDPMAGKTWQGAAEVGLQEIVVKAREVDELIAEIPAASRAQSQGIVQVNSAVSQMDKVTRSNAASAEESASASQELFAQTETMQQAVRELEQLLGKTTQAVASSLAGDPTASKTKRPTTPASRTNRLNGGSSPATAPPRNNGNGAAHLAAARAIPMEGDSREF